MAVKDAVLDLDITSRTCTEIPELEVYSGQDTFTLPMMSVGAVGVVSVISHLAGVQVAAMVKAAADGDYQRALELHQALLPLGFACFLESNPAPVKAALNSLWAPVGDPRLPLLPASDKTVAAIKDSLAHL